MIPKTYSIKHWSKDDRPREKLLLKGASALSNAELLAILINHGSQGKSAVQLAREILLLGNNKLNELGKLTIPQLMQIKGIGEAKAISIAAALELGRRRETAFYEDYPQVKQSKDVAHYLRSMLLDLRNEFFIVLFLNQANKITHPEIISIGGISGTIADTRIILKKALEKNAVSIILCHNHPSGSLKPSMADKQITRKIHDAANLLDIKVLDHIIVSEHGYFSFADEGLL